MQNLENIHSLVLSWIIQNYLVSLSILSFSIYRCLFAFPLILMIFQVNVEESLWQALEEDMTPSAAGLKSNWLELQSKILPKKYKESNVCIAGGMSTILHTIQVKK